MKTLGEPAVSIAGARAANPRSAYPVAATAEPRDRMVVPVDDVQNPEFSIVIPARNEEKTIGEFVDWCKQGLAGAGVVGEILIVDSSNDSTAEIALQQGARVLLTPPRGLGRAYIDALPYIRGRYVLMGDADCTYDFRDLAPFVRAFRQGFEFVMGSRWKGGIEPGAMPALHRYLGTPVTTWILNLLFSSQFSDIHCGMRGITAAALQKIGLESQSWEYASEMVLKSVHARLRTTEVPVHFLRDRNGRLSHHARAGWFSPFHAAWINLRAMFIYGVEFFALIPGLVILGLGLLLSLPLILGPLSIGPVRFSLLWMLLGMSLSLLGLQSFYLGCVAQVLHDYDGSARRRWLRLFAYTRTVALSAIAFAGGFALSLVLVTDYVRSGLTFTAGDRLPYIGVFGLMLMVISFMTFTFDLLLHAAALRSERLYGTHR